MTYSSSTSLSGTTSSRLWISRRQKSSSGYAPRTSRFTWIRAQWSYLSIKDTIQPTALDRCAVLWRNTWRIRWPRSYCEGTSSRATRLTCTQLLNNWRSRWLAPKQGETGKKRSPRELAALTGDKLCAPSRDRRETSQALLDHQW